MVAETVARQVIKLLLVLATQPSQFVQEKWPRHQHNLVLIQAVQFIAMPQLEIRAWNLRKSIILLPKTYMSGIASLALLDHSAQLAFLLDTGIVLAPTQLSQRRLLHRQRYPQDQQLRLPQSGIVSNCDKYAKTSSGDTCQSFAAKQGIGTDQLYTWNKQLGAQGQNCASEFWADYYYCVDAPTTMTSTGAGSTTTPAPVPSPTQSGIVSNCNKYFQAHSGDTCETFAQANAITANQLYAWNTQLGAHGENCNTLFWAEEYYCIGISGKSKREEDPKAMSLNPRSTYYPLDKRDLPTGTCNAQTLCVNGACCGSDNLCGYSSKSCGSGCQHNCKR